MNQSAWLIRGGNNTFIGVIHDLNEVRTNIYVGGKKKGCVVLEVNKIDNDATLHVGYDRKCNTTGDLPNQRGTIALIKASCSFMFQRFPSITQVVFRDTSTIKCNNEEKLSLSRMHLFLYGKTWYQRHLHAEPQKGHGKLDAFLKVVKTKPSFAHIWEIIDESIRVRDDRATKKMLSVVYESSSNIREWIVNLITDSNGKRLDCQVLTPWLSILFNALSNNLPINEMEWTIQKQRLLVNIDTDELEESPYGARIQRRADFMMGGYESRGSSDDYELIENWRDLIVRPSNQNH